MKRFKSIFTEDAHGRKYGQGFDLNEDPEDEDLSDCKNQLANGASDLMGTDLKKASDILDRDFLQSVLNIK